MEYSQLPSGCEIRSNFCVKPHSKIDTQSGIDAGAMRTFEAYTTIFAGKTNATTLKMREADCHLG